MLLEHRLHVSEPTTRPGQLTPYAKRHPKQVTHPRRPLGISLSQEGVMSSLPGGVGLLVGPDQNAARPHFSKSAAVSASARSASANPDAAADHGPAS